MWRQKGRLFDVLKLSDNWYVIVLPPVEEEIRCRREETARGKV